MPTAIEAQIGPAPLFPLNFGHAVAAAAGERAQCRALPTPRRPTVTESTACTIASLHLHPVKSCAGIAVDQALLIETGLEFDRAWMVVDASGEMITQRERPRLALVRPTLRGDDVVLRAPGMLAMHLSLDTAEAPTRARVWDDDVPAFDMGPLAAQWFADYLGQTARLVRFDPGHRRLSSPRWTGDVAAENAFSDEFPLLVTSVASLADLNRRLAARGVPEVGMDRFRPNLVLDGVQAYDEDHLDEIVFEGGDGPVRLRLVKPCTRCTIPNVDPLTATAATEPGATLASYRANARVGGGVTFGMNAVIVEGVDRVLRAGMDGRARWAL